MNRRDAVVAFGAFGVALPLGAHAQTPGRVWRVGVLGLGRRQVGMVYVQALRKD